MPESPLAIFLSPHFDDIALSCGGMAARLSRRGARCFAVTIFAAPAPEDTPLSPFAHALHNEWERAAGQDMRAINEVRRDEERDALRLLGLDPAWLDFPDAPYRRSQNGRHLYTSDEGLFGKVAPEEQRRLAPLIAGEIRRVAHETGVRGPVRVFAPLGVGNHVDHQLVFSAARLLPPRYGVLFYEDYPYAAKPGALEARLRHLSGLGLPLEPRSISISDLLGVKIAAITRYKSQLPILFGSNDAMPQAVRAYAQLVAGDAGYAERFWYLTPIYTLSG